MKKSSKKPTVRTRHLDHQPTGRSKLKKNNQARKALPAHKRFLLHPVTVMIILVTGVFMVGITYQVIAATIISSVISAPPLSVGATIVSPIASSTLTTATVSVKGTCPDNSYVNLYTNSTFSGVAWCSADNTWQIQTSLFDSGNSLVAQDYNVTDDQGPATPAVTVVYTPPAPAPAPAPVVSIPSSAPSSTSAPSPASATTTTAVSLPIVFTSNFHYKTFSTGHTFSWTVNLQGGVPPYVIHVNWGDGTSSTLTFPTDPTFTIHHTYAHAGYFPIVMHTVDATGATRVLQLAALIKPPGASGVINFNSLTNAPTTKPADAIKTLETKTKSWLWFAWPTYIIILLMLVSFWLGEKEGHQNFFKRHRKHRLHVAAYKRK